MAERQLPDRQTLQQWFEDEHLSHQQMADRFNALPERKGRKPVTRQAFTRALQRYGFTTYYHHDEWLPADMRPEHTKLYDTEMIRRWSARKQGKKFDDVEEQRINAWLQNLRDAGAILLYQRDTQKGWWPVPRSIGDDPDVPVRVV